MWSAGRRSHEDGPHVPPRSSQQTKGSPQAASPPFCTFVLDCSARRACRDSGRRGSASTTRFRNKGSQHVAAQWRSCSTRQRVCCGQLDIRGQPHPFQEADAHPRHVELTVAEAVPCRVLERICTPTRERYFVAGSATSHRRYSGGGPRVDDWGQSERAGPTRLLPARWSLERAREGQRVASPRRVW